VEISAIAATAREIADIMKLDIWSKFISFSNHTRVFRHSQTLWNIRFDSLFFRGIMLIL
jgi:hypothetical protein